MSEEEKETIDHLKFVCEYSRNDIKITVNKIDVEILLKVIKKQQKKIQKLQTIDKEHQKLNGELREEIEEKYIKKNFISKDKIREKIEEYKKPKKFKEVDEYGEIIEGEIIYKDIVEALKKILKEE